MSRLRLLNPFRMRAAVRAIREATGGGGPAAVRVAGIGHPRGLLVPTARVTLEVKARDGSVSRFEPELPVPFPYAWAWRIARRLGVPLVRSFDPGAVRFEVPMPGR